MILCNDKYFLLMLFYKYYHQMGFQALLGEMHFFITKKNEIFTLIFKISNNHGSMERI